jgi:glutamate racemase
VIPLIQQIVGEDVRVIDPAPSVAKQVRRVLEAEGLKKQSVQQGNVRFYTSGETEALKSLLPVLLGELGNVEKVVWVSDTALAMD